MNYNQNKDALIAVIRLPKRGVYGKHNRGRTISHENFSPVPTCFLLTFYPFHTIYYLVMKLPKTITQKSETIEIVKSEMEIIVKIEMTMEKNYKRQYRECPVEVRQKISAKMKGRKKSDMTKQRISMGMKNYWRDVPSMSGSDFTSTGRIV